MLTFIERLMSGIPALNQGLRDMPIEELKERAFPRKGFRRAQNQGNQRAEKKT